MNKIITLLLVMICALSLTSCKKTNQIEEDYPSLVGKDTIIHYVDGEDVVEKLSKKDNAIIMFGFKNCPWCQSAISYVDEIAKEKGYEEVYYLDIKDMRDNEESEDRDIYLSIYNTIKEKIGNPDKIYAPTVIVLKDGEITGYNEGTVVSHERVDGTLPPMTDEQKEELRQIYRNIF